MKIQTGSSKPSLPTLDRKTLTGNASHVWVYQRLVAYYLSEIRLWTEAKKNTSLKGLPLVKHL